MTIESPQRDRILTVFAVLFAVLAISNLLKPLQLGGEQTGFVFFGTRLSGWANTLAGPIFAAYLGVYAHAIWTQRRYAIPLAHAYALYVLVNLYLYNLNYTRPPGIGYLLFGIAYIAVAVGVSLGAAIVLTKRKEQLR
jgi:hypothetical protein